MDINTKLNMTFLIFSLLSILFINVASKNNYDPSYGVKGFIVFIAGVSFIGLIVTSLIRVWS